MPETLNGRRIDDRLDELDVSPADFAARVDLSDGYFRNLRNGSNKCSSRTAGRIARGLALPVDEIVLSSAPDGRREPKAANASETKEEPTHPKRRQDTEQTKTGPKRPDDVLAGAL